MLRYILIFLDFNPIGNKGCFELCKAKWNHLQFITLGELLTILGGCSIGDEGCEYLGRTQWHNLQFLDLGKLVEMKHAIR